jgi:hypothetical protein
MKIKTKHSFYTIFYLFQLFCGIKGYCQSNDSTLLSNDSLIFCHKAELLKPIIKGDLGKLLVETALSFEGIPYVGKTLDGNIDESLVVNLHELDCTTFVESCLAIVLTLESDNITFKEYKDNLETLRYRDGNLEGYESRLHYFSDWIYDNQRKGIIRDITHKLGGIPFTKEINFMSTHPAYYAQLKDNQTMVDSISKIEKEISSRRLFYIPKENVKAIEPKLKEGMIVAITSAVAGLDIAHLGFLVKIKGQIHLLHASSDFRKVMISEKTLSDYLAGNKKQTGIMVLKVIK